MKVCGFGGKNRTIGERKEEATRGRTNLSGGASGTVCHVSTMDIVGLVSFGLYVERRSRRSKGGGGEG